VTTGARGEALGAGDAFAGAECHGVELVFPTQASGEASADELVS
jgi:hypothetical protein